MIWNISFKNLHHLYLFEKGASFPQTLNIILNFKLELLCVYSGPFIKKVWYSLKNGWEVVVFSLQKIKLLEGDAILSYEIELPFHM